MNHYFCLSFFVCLHLLFVCHISAFSHIHSSRNPINTVLQLRYPHKVKLRCPNLAIDVQYFTNSWYECSFTHFYFIFKTSPNQMKIIFHWDNISAVQWSVQKSISVDVLLSHSRSALNRERSFEKLLSRVSWELSCLKTPYPLVECWICHTTFQKRVEYSQHLFGHSVKMHTIHFHF